MQKIRQKIITGSLFVLCLAATTAALQTANMLTTVPQKMVYNGHLLNSSGEPITTGHSVRFSIWSSPDFRLSEIASDGSIATGTGSYAGWQETHNVTPNAQGYFSVELGSVNSLFDISTMPRDTLMGLYLQVEVKTIAAADTAFEVLDIDSADDDNDRSPLLSVPFALNADYLDQREIGTGSGDIVILQEGGIFPTGVIPGGTDQTQFIIDFGNISSSGLISLQFGQQLGKTLSYNIDDGWFEFNDDLFVEGNLTVSGGLIVGNYEPGTGTGAGAIRFTGTDFEGYDGSNWKSLTGGGYFVGVSSWTSAGSFGTGSLVGYQAANNICSLEYSGSHMCQIGEVIATIDKNINLFSGAYNAWVAEGAPGFTSDSNDCRGWTSDNGDHLGAWWEYSTDGGVTTSNGGGQGFLTNCAVVQPIACCI